MIFTWGRSNKKIGINVFFGCLVGGGGDAVVVGEGDAGHGDGGVRTALVLLVVVTLFTIIVIGDGCSHEP